MSRNRMEAFIAVQTIFLSSWYGLSRITGWKQGRERVGKSEYFSDQ